MGQVRQELELSQKRQNEQLENSGAEQTKLQDRIKELQAVQTEVEQKVVTLTPALEQETKRREGAEQQAGELGQLRGKLETALAAARQEHANLRQELEQAQKQQQALRNSGEEQSGLKPGSKR